MAQFAPNAPNAPNTKSASNAPNSLGIIGGTADYLLTKYQDPQEPFVVGRQLP